MTREEKLVKVLLSTRALLQSYGDQHMAKTPPQRGKALTNYLQVDLINRALLSEDDSPLTNEDRQSYTPE